MAVLHPISAPAVRLLPAEDSPIPITARAQPIRAAAAGPRATSAGAYFPTATADALGPRWCNAGETRVD
jgi:hypothetical protein